MAQFEVFKYSTGQKNGIDDGLELAVVQVSSTPQGAHESTYVQKF